MEESKEQSFGIDGTVTLSTTDLPSTTPTLRLVPPKSIPNHIQFDYFT